MWEGFFSVKSTRSSSSVRLFWPGLTQVIWSTKKQLPNGRKKHHFYPFLVVKISQPFAKHFESIPNPEFFSFHRGSTIVNLHHMPARPAVDIQPYLWVDLFCKRLYPKKKRSNRLNRGIGVFFLLSCCFTYLLICVGLLKILNIF